MTPTPETGTARIRWEPNGPESGCCGFVGTMKPWAFQIWRDGTPGACYRLDSALLGQFGYHVNHPDPEPLKLHAERWLSEFVASIGASFPPEPAKQFSMCEECGGIVELPAKICGPCLTTAQAKTSPASTEKD